jgi:hypothetical protein
MYGLVYSSPLVKRGATCRNGGKTHSGSWDQMSRDTERRVTMSVFRQTGPGNADFSLWVVGRGVNRNSLDYLCNSSAVNLKLF